MALEIERYRHFSSLAQTFCARMESPTGMRAEALRPIRAGLVSLYAAAIHLPDITKARFEELPAASEEIAASDRARIANRLKTLGLQDTYHAIAEPLAATPATVSCSLIDDLADIWSDLKPGLALLETNAAEWEADIYWNWKFTFRNHWGRHAIDALRAMHDILQDAR